MGSEEALECNPQIQYMAETTPFWMADSEAFFDYRNAPLKDTKGRVA